MSKEFFWPTWFVQGIPPPPQPVIRKRAKRGAPLPEITAEMNQAQITAIRNKAAMRLKRAAERVNRFTEQITSEQWRAGVDRRASIKGGSSAFRSI